MWNLIAVDISGRHKITDGYYMVCAAVAVVSSADHVEKVNQVKIKPFWMDTAPQVTDVVRIIEETVKEIEVEGTIITEKGDMYNKPEWVVTSMFSRNFKYQESLSERLAIEIAHHISLSARNLLIEELNIS
ncbi:MAG: DUF2209 domain-containing protein [Methanohalobium sp.]|uniref:DUF2209 domain-containing protein n=1 Tax=Methanohalobium sp. TaxID=2837493 RepID=UPI00397B4C4C